MANATSSDAMIPGRAALAGRPGITIAAPDGSNTGLRVEEIAHLGKLNIRGGKAIASIIKTHTGCDFPPANNKVKSTGARHVVWLGPDEALLLCEAGLEVKLYRQINAAFADQHAAITNVTDGYCALRLTGGDVRRVLAKGCALDLHPNVFGNGACAQTTLAHAGVTLIAMDTDCFLLLCRTSFAPYTLDWLQDAALEYGFTYA